MMEWLSIAVAWLPTPLSAVSIGVTVLYVCRQKKLLAMRRAVNEAPDPISFDEALEMLRKANRQKLLKERGQR